MRPSAPAAATRLTLSTATGGVSTASSGLTPRKAEKGARLNSCNIWRRLGRRYRAAQETKTGEESERRGGAGGGKERHQESPSTERHMHTCVRNQATLGLTTSVRALYCEVRLPGCRQKPREIRSWGVTISNNEQGFSRRASHPTTPETTKEGNGLTRRMTRSKGRENVSHRYIWARCSPCRTKGSLDGFLLLVSWPTNETRSHMGDHRSSHARSRCISIRD